MLNILSGKICEQYPALKERGLRSLRKRGVMRSICYNKTLYFLLIVFAFCQFGYKPALAQDSCSFNDVVDGNLGAEIDDLTALSSTANANSVTTVDGRPGSINVICNSPTANINISSVVQSNTAGINVSDFTTTVTGLGSEIVSNNGGASMTAPIGTSSLQTLEINISAIYNSILKSGNYTYTVNFNVTP